MSNKNKLQAAVGSDIKSQIVSALHLKDKVLLLRTCNKDGSSYNGFQWSTKPGSIVKAPDWNPEPVCGGGLHGLIDGKGAPDMLNWEKDAIALVIMASSKDVVDLGHKAKVAECFVMMSGSLQDATNYLVNLGYTEVVGANVTRGDNEIAQVGARGSAIVGSGNDAKAIAGNSGTAIAGTRAYAEAGIYGTAIVGAEGIAKAANYGTAKAGILGKAIVGNYGTAQVSIRGIAIAGLKSTIIKEWYCHSKNCKRTTIGYVGENGIEPNVPYTTNIQGELVKC